MKKKEGRSREEGASNHFPDISSCHFLLWKVNNLYTIYEQSLSLLIGSLKNPPANAGDAGLIPGLGRSPGDRQPSAVFLPRKSHGQRGLAGSSARGSQKESDTTWQLKNNNVRLGTSCFDSYLINTYTCFMLSVLLQIRIPYISITHKVF